MTLRVCLNTEIGFSSFLSRALIITFSPPRTRSKPPSLEAFYHFPSILTDFNSLPPASLSLVLLHFNCDFHGYLTRSRSTCIKCSSGINLLLVLKPRLFGLGYPTDIPFTVRNSLTKTDFK